MRVVYEILVTYVNVHALSRLGLNLDYSILLRFTRVIYMSMKINLLFKLNLKLSLF